MKYIVTVEPAENPRSWTLSNTITYCGITVPKGFVTDGASIPVVLRWIFPHGGAKFAPAVFHDWCYKTGVFTKEKADGLFYLMMVGNEVPEWKAQLMYQAVKYFGRFAWRNHRRNK